MIDPTRPAPLNATKQNWDERFHTHEVHAWAIMTNETRIVSYVDPSIPDFDKVCNAYKDKGFHVVKLFGEIEMAEETVTISLDELENAIKAFMPNVPTFLSIAKSLGFKRGIK